MRWELSAPTKYELTINLKTAKAGGSARPSLPAQRSDATGGPPQPRRGAELTGDSAAGRSEPWGLSWAAAEIRRRYQGIAKGRRSTAAAVACPWAFSRSARSSETRCEMLYERCSFDAFPMFAPIGCQPEARNQTLLLQRLPTAHLPPPSPRRGHHAARHLESRAIPGARTSSTDCRGGLQRGENQRVHLAWTPSPAGEDVTPCSGVDVGDAAGQGEDLA